MAAQIGQLQVAHVLAVDEHAARAGVVEARDEVGERGLAAAGVADEGEGAAGRDLEADALQHRPVDVAEPDVVEGDGAGGGRARRRGSGRQPERPSGFASGRSVISSGESSTSYTRSPLAMARCARPVSQPITWAGYTSIIR